MKNIKDEWVSGELLGRGSFATVRQCVKKNDPDQSIYAVKTIDKTKLKLSKRNISQ